MSPHILQALLRQATEYQSNGDDTESPVINQEKFAELIVRECLKNMENCDGDLDFAIWKTKQDFGVAK